MGVCVEGRLWASHSALCQCPLVRPSHSLEEGWSHTHLSSGIFSLEGLVRLYVCTAPIICSNICVREGGGHKGVCTIILPLQDGP